MNSVPQKQCKKCGNFYPATTEYFRLRRRDNSEYLESPCIPCIHAKKREDHIRDREKNNSRTRRWAEQNADYVREKARQYYQEHREERIAYVSQYQRDNADKINAYRRQRYHSDIERFRAINRKNSKTYYHRLSVDVRRAKRTTRAVYSREYARRTYDPIKQRAKSHRRRLKIQNSTEHFTTADIALQYKSQKGKCWHCGKALNNRFHVDHLIPLAKGGSNSPRNIVCSCEFCNTSKGAKHVWEWVGRLF